MLRTCLFILFVFSFIPCDAQTDSIKNTQAALKLSSNSSVLYPGISAGAEFPVGKEERKALIIKSPSRSFFRTRLIAGNLSWYHHPEFHDNIYVTAEWVMRRTRPGGFISEFSAGPGYSRTFLSGTTYKVGTGGIITIDRLAGYNYALITVGGGFGYDFSMKKQVPLSIFSKMNVISMFPFNSTIYYRPVLEIGIRYSPWRCYNGTNK